MKVANIRKCLKTNLTTDKLKANQIMVPCGSLKEITRSLKVPG